MHTLEGLLPRSWLLLESPAALPATTTTRRRRRGARRLRAAGLPSTTSATARRCWASWTWPSWAPTPVSPWGLLGAGAGRCGVVRGVCCPWRWSPAVATSHRTCPPALLRALPPAVGMFVSGHLGDRVDLRYFLTGRWVQVAAVSERFWRACLGPLVLLAADGGGQHGQRALWVERRPLAPFPLAPFPHPLAAPQAACWAAARAWRCSAPPTSGRSTPWPTLWRCRSWEVRQHGAGGCGGVGQQPAHERRSSVGGRWLKPACASA